MDDLLADDSNSDGLFSGFQTLSNNDLDMFAMPQGNTTYSHQHSNSPSASASEGRSPSDGSDGETSHIKPYSSTAKAAVHGQAAPVQLRHSDNQTVNGASPGASETTQTGSPWLATEHRALPSLVGLTAGEVAQAVGYSTAKQPAAQQSKNSAQAHAAQPPVRKQANGKKKRGRDAPAAAATSSGASEQHGGSTGAVEMSSRAGSPGVSSSGDVSPGEVHQEASAGGASAADSEEQKRMVGLFVPSWLPLLARLLACLDLSASPSTQSGSLLLVTPFAYINQCCQQLGASMFKLHLTCLVGDTVTVDATHNHNRSDTRSLWPTAWGISSRSSAGAHAAQQGERPPEPAAQEDADG